MKRERAEEYAIYDAEDGGIRADAERESQDGDRGEARAFCRSRKAKRMSCISLNMGSPEA